MTVVTVREIGGPIYAAGAQMRLLKGAFVSALTLAGVTTTISAQDSSSQAVAYCSDLKRVVALASTKDRFSSITGKAREGNFMDTSLPLTGWKDCSLYGPRTYTCDSQGIATSEQAEKAQAGVLKEIQACLGDTWTEAKDRSSPSYVVLHSSRAPLSITLSTDQNEQKQHVVRLVMFRRSN